MINHKYKCIFIHIQGTGGSSIEQAVHGKDWWEVRPDTKHIRASTAKRIYSDYWDEYFKFGFVRNPWSRLLSLSRFPSQTGVTINNKVTPPTINLDKYLEKFPDCEIDPRSASNHDRDDILEGGVYMSLLGQELDFIGKLENIKEDFSYISDKIKCRSQLPHMKKSNRKKLPGHYTDYYNDQLIDVVRKRHMLDIEKFKYKFEE